MAVNHTDEGSNPRGVFSNIGVVHGRSFDWKSKDEGSIPPPPQLIDIEDRGNIYITCTLSESLSWLGWKAWKTI